jgi:hypothetical protein
MAKADSVLSTPPTDTSKSTVGAPGAVQLSPVSLIPASRPGASQDLASECEPPAASPTCSSGAGSSMTRRFLMNSIVALPIAAAVPTAAPAMLSHPSDDRLVAAAEGLFASEAAIDQLYREHDPTAADGEVDERADCRTLFAVQDQHIATLIAVPATSNAGLQAKASVVRAKFMADGFRPHHKSLAVSLANDLVGDVRSELPAGGPTPHPDARLLELEEKIFKHKEAFDALQPETDRLDNIWCNENRRLSAEVEKTQMTFKEQNALVGAMPEFKEFMRLRELQEDQREAADDLVKQMWEIKAQTPEGRRAKVLVLLGYVMEDDEWRRSFDEPFDLTRARDLMIEFVGGEPATQLCDQFAA